MPRVSKEECQHLDLEVRAEEGLVYIHCPDCDTDGSIPADFIFSTNESEHLDEGDDESH